MFGNYKIIVYDSNHDRFVDFQRDLTYADALDICNEYRWSWYGQAHGDDMYIVEQEQEDEGGAYCE